MTENKDFKLVFKNRELGPAAMFLQELELKASDSRHRTKLVKELVSCSNQYAEDQMSLIEQYGQREDDGSLKLADDDGQSYLIKPESVLEYHKENNSLSDEDIVITGGAYVNSIMQLEDVLLNYTGELSGQSADIYDRLLDEFEKNH